MKQYANTVTDPNGIAISGAQVLVQTAAGVTASIYSDNGVTPATNPLTTNSLGAFSFYAADGIYTLTITATGHPSKTLRNVVIDETIGVTYAELASNANGSGASLVGIEDSGSLIAATNVESALAEVATDINTLDTGKASLAQLASTSDPALGDALVGGKRTDTGAVAFTLHAFHENRVVNVKTDFGAVGDGTTDDASAFQAALDSGAMEIYVPPGTYNLGSTITSFDSANTTCPVLIGAGVDKTILRATHSSGPVLHVKGWFGGAVNLTVSATSARTNGSAGSNYGILQEAADAASNTTRFGKYERLRISGQPSHGLVLIGEGAGTEVKNCWIFSNGGHGIIIDDGTLTSRTNVVRPGDIRIHGNTIRINTGNGIVVGDLGATGSNLAYRMSIYNNDIFSNALTAGVRLVDSQVYVFSDNSQIWNNAFGGFTADTFTPTTKGLHVAGRVIRVKNNRYIDVLTNAVVVSGPAIIETNDVEIDGLYIEGVNQVALDPAVTADSAVTGILVRSKRTINITSLFDRTANEKVDVEFSTQKSTDRSYVAADFGSRASTISLADDTATSIAFDASPSSGIVVIAGNTAAAGAGVFFFRVGSSPDVQIIGEIGPCAVTTGALTGTTGVDGNLTISAHTDQKLYVENRTSVPIVLNVTFLSMAAGMASSL